MIPEGMKPYFDYLEKLRRSGRTNMYGAVPFLITECGLERREATNVLVSWMENYDHNDYKDLK